MSLRRAALWTVIRTDKWSVWRDSNESCSFLSLLAHKYYIEHLSNSSYRFIEKNDIAIIIVTKLSPSPSEAKMLPPDPEIVLFIPVSIKVRRCIVQLRIHIQRRWYWPPLLFGISASARYIVIMSPLEQAPDWLTGCEIFAKVQISQLAITHYAHQTPKTLNWQNA